VSRIVVVGGGGWPEGKGPLIAAALGRLAADAALVAPVGDDKALRAALEEVGVALAPLETCGDGCELVVLQAEAADSALTAAARWARERRGSQASPPGRRALPLITLSASPARRLPRTVWQVADIAVCNRAEAAALAGLPAGDPLDAEDAARALCGGDSRTVVVTLGSEGAVVARRGRATYLPPFTVEVVDPAGAGECFCAALAFATSEGMDHFAAAGYAMAAAAVCVGREGGAAAMPTRDEVERMAHSVDLRRDPGTSPVVFPR